MNNSNPRIPNNVIPNNRIPNTLSTVSSSTSDFPITNNIKSGSSQSSNSKSSEYSLFGDYQTILLLIVGFYFLYNMLNQPSVKFNDKEKTKSSSSVSTVSTETTSSSVSSKEIKKRY